MSTVVYKRGDTAPALRATLKDRNGNAVDVSGATITLVLRKVGISPPAPTTYTVTIIDGPTGVVERDWQTGDLNTIGWFEVEWQVAYVGGKIESFPGEGYDLLGVISDLNPP